MRYFFESKVEKKDAGYTIQIPFNVWEVCDSQGTLPVKVAINEDTFSCDLLPEGKGIYNIPVPTEIYEKLGDSTFKISFQILNMMTHFSGNSPYSATNPIRKIDSMKLVNQPFDGLC